MDTNTILCVFLVSTLFVTFSFQNPIFLIGICYCPEMKGFQSLPTRKDHSLKFLSSLKVTNGNRKQHAGDLRKSMCMSAGGCLRFLGRVVVNQDSWLSWSESKIKTSPWKGPLRAASGCQFLAAQENHLEHLCVFDTWAPSLQILI